MSSPDVDHVLPWSFVLEDKTWNLVLACRKCNNAKRDRLTDVGALELLCSRNEKILKGAINSEPAFRRHFAEWHSRNLSAFVKSFMIKQLRMAFQTGGDLSYRGLSVCRVLQDQSRNQRIRISLLRLLIVRLRTERSGR